MLTCVPTKWCQLCFLLNVLASLVSRFPDILWVDIWLSPMVNFNIMLFPTRVSTRLSQENPLRRIVITTRGSHNPQTTKAIQTLTEEKTFSPSLSLFQETWKKWSLGKLDYWGVQCEIDHVSWARLAFPSLRIPAFVSLSPSPTVRNPAGTMGLFQGSGVPCQHWNGQEC